MKTCRDCKKFKNKREFVKNKAFKSGIDTLCRVCNRKRVKAWRKSNPNKRKVQMRREYIQDRDSGRAKARQAHRRAAKKNRTPNWAELKEIKEFYKYCPKGYEVDHIIPLQGKRVSGLHVLKNLQYLPRLLNRQKHNKFTGY